MKIEGISINETWAASQSEAAFIEHLTPIAKKVWTKKTDGQIQAALISAHKLINPENDDSQGNAGTLPAGQPDRTNGRSNRRRSGDGNKPDEESVEAGTEQEGGETTEVQE